MVSTAGPLDSIPRWTLTVPSRRNKTSAHLGPTTNRGGYHYFGRSGEYYFGNDSVVRRPGRAAPCRLNGSPPNPSEAPSAPSPRLRTAARVSTDAAGPTEDDVRVDEESVRLQLIALVVKEMNRDGEAVTVTNHERPVAVLSPVPASEETRPVFVGMMRGTVAPHRSAQRGPYMAQLTPRVVQSFCEDPVLRRGRPPPFRQRW